MELGEKLLDLYTTEFVLQKYQKLSADVVSSLVKSLSGSNALASVGRGLGVNQIMRWKGSADVSLRPVEPFKPIPNTELSKVVVAPGEDAVTAQVMVRDWFYALASAYWSVI